jgi:hypothetical protein
MPALESILQARGEWVGTSRLTDPPTGLDESSQTRLAIEPRLRNRFALIEYDWNFRGEPQQGLLLIGHDGLEADVSALWSDTFHTGRE